MIQQSFRSLAPRQDEVTLRPARRADADAIMRLVNGYAAEGIMLPRSLDSVVHALDDFVVAVDRRGNLLGCGALKEYSPSLAEVHSPSPVNNRSSSRTVRSHKPWAVLPSPSMAVRLKSFLSHRCRSTSLCLHKPNLVSPKL